jgi:type VI protein secretion system component VasK
MFASSYPLLDIFWWFLEVFLFVIWIWLLFVVFADIFRSQDMRGWAKALWVIGVIIFPYIGVLVYLIARGSKMHERAASQAQDQRQAFDAYVRQSAGTGTSTADQLTKLADLKSKGVLTDAEFETEKAKVLGSSASA